MTWEMILDYLSEPSVITGVVTKRGRRVRAREGDVTTEAEAGDAKWGL